MQKPHVLVLGSTGMLGAMVGSYFKKSPDFITSLTSREADATLRFDAEDSASVTAFDFKPYDYVINCIGIIKPYCKDNDPAGIQRAIRVNAQMPWQISQKVRGTKTKIIQIATDCVYSGAKGAYMESDAHDALDVYGKTKSLGEVFDNSQFLNIRCSIIGPELKVKLSLLEWFLGQPEGAQLNGFTHHDWNGVTTLQFAQLCAAIILEGRFDGIRSRHHAPHYFPNKTMTKFEMLNIFRDVYNRKVTIAASTNGAKVDRTLSSQLTDTLPNQGQKPLLEAIREMSAFSLN